ncbi:MbcA/ParS/Xre antitoxin family protein [Acinetobacter variabilis]|uniref:MbcA/ParS/Xre antitoxin family protein n=1 Tax=Acinetobacter variabilis TaxID=70346 RepID=UPI0028B1BAC3|nr:MbcA/ParS/Xre antitoxin family protein [Acinetobacter variabilis]
MRTRPSLTGGDLSWMRQFINSPNKLLDEQTPRSLIQTGHGLSAVLRLLGRLQPH